MKLLRSFSVALGLALALADAGCVKYTQTERRTVELPAGHPEATLATAEQICRGLVAHGFAAEIRKKYPMLTQAQLEGIMLSWNSGVFKGRTTIFIMTGINYGGDLPQAKAVADDCQALVKRAVEERFPRGRP